MAVTIGGAAAPGAAKVWRSAAAASAIHARRPITGRRSPEAEAEHDVGAVTAVAVVLAGQVERGQELVLDAHLLLSRPGRVLRGADGRRSLLTGEAVELGGAVARGAGADAQPGHAGIDAQYLLG